MILSCLSLRAACRFYVGMLLCLAAFSCRVAKAQPYDPAPNQLKVMTWNVEWLYDDYTGDNRSKLAKEQSAPSREYFRSRVEGVADAIAAAKPDIVALQEIEGDQTLREIIGQIKSRHRISYRFAFIQGTDTYTEQDVGILMRSGLVSYTRHEQSKTMFDSKEFHNLSKQISAEFRWSDVPARLTLMNVHLRATADAEKTRVKQAKLARHFLEEPLQAGNDVILLGDFNSESKAGEIVGDIREIAGESGSPKMVDVLAYLEDKTAPTHLILNRQFDRIMVSESMMVDGPGVDWSFEKVEVFPQLVIRGKRDGDEHWDDRLTADPRELDVSDHLPAMATFRKR